MGIPGAGLLAHLRGDSTINNLIGYVQEGNHTPIEYKANFKGGNQIQNVILPTCTCMYTDHKNVHHKRQECTIKTRYYRALLQNPISSAVYELQ